MRALRRFIPSQRSASLQCRWAAAAVAPGTARQSDDAKNLAEDLKQLFGRMGLVSHKKVGVRDLMNILRVSQTKSDYRDSLYMMNMFYNYGVKLNHREIATRLLATAMRCEQESEAVELIKLYSTWLEHAPDSALIYAVMGHFSDKGQPLVVRELAKAVREDWRIAVEPPLYILGIEAMLQLPDDPVGEAMALYEDARQMGVRLPAPLHTRLLSESLHAFEAVPAEDLPGADEEKSDAPEDSEAPAMSLAPVSDVALQHLQAGVRTAEGLIRDGHLRGGANASTLCSLAWLHWRLSTLPEAVHIDVIGGAEFSGVRGFLDGDWVRILDAAVDNFGCHWGFSSSLPRGLFAALEASTLPEAARLVAASRARFGRFYPVEGV